MDFLSIVSQECDHKSMFLSKLTTVLVKKNPSSQHFPPYKDLSLKLYEVCSDFWFLTRARRRWNASAHQYQILICEICDSCDGWMPNPLSFQRNRKTKTKQKQKRNGQVQSSQGALEQRHLTSSCSRAAGRQLQRTVFVQGSSHRDCVKVKQGDAATEHDILAFCLQQLREWDIILWRKGQLNQCNINNQASHWLSLHGWQYSPNKVFPWDSWRIFHSYSHLHAHIVNFQIDCDMEIWVNLVLFSIFST